MIYHQSEAEIASRIAKREVSVGFIGLGRVGLPLAATLAAEGFCVTGLDINPKTVAAVNSGQSPVPDENGLPELIKKVTAQGKLKASTHWSDIAGCEAYIIAVPTLIKDQQPDIDAVIAVAHQLAKIMKPGKLVVLQSTVPPGTTRNTLGAIIQQESGLKAGSDFGLAYSPERTQSPQVLRDLKAYPKIIGGLDRKSCLILAGLYGSFAPSVVTMSSLMAAELDKVIENTYRDVNIAFANELARICQVYGLDVSEIIATANSQPFCHILAPGLVGGHCIPMDPYYIISDLLSRNYDPRLIRTARELNESMFPYITGFLGDGVRRVAILGLSFKKDIRSFETSHTLKLVKLLQGRNIEVMVHDPFITGEALPFESTADLDAACLDADAIIISTAHSAYEKLDLEKIKAGMRGRLIIDVRNMLDPVEVSRHGLVYQGLGR